MPELTLIKGGRENPPSLVYNFIEAAVTDSRLMGVLGLRVHWLVESDEVQPRHIYMFFYYDVEELGLDTVSVYELYDEEAVELATKSCFGGLGAKMVEVNEKESRYLISRFVRKTTERKQPLPENAAILDDILKSPAELSLSETEVLNQKMCTELVNNYSIVNYYLMRGFGKDTDGVKLLRSGSAAEDAFDDISLDTHATFLKNSIQAYNNEDGNTSYLSESLVETENNHFIVTSELWIEDGKVIQARKKRVFRISVEEASMLLTRGEYCTVYRILIPMEDFDVDFASFSIGTTRTEHENGDMFMEFKPDNSHVDGPDFKLYDDIKALYFVSDYGELIVAAYSQEEIKEAERKIRKTFLMTDVKIMVKMQLARSVLYDFVDSNYSYFGQFIKSLE